jgi:molybdenum cofactor synthesis domain-containing protein
MADSESSHDPAPAPRRAIVITASTRAAAGVWPDRSGPILADGLRQAGLLVADPIVVADGEPVIQALREALTTGIDLIVTTGGTGLTPTDRTPEATAAVIDREIPGIAEAIRKVGVDNGIATAALSRGIAGLCRIHPDRQSPWISRWCARRTHGTHTDSQPRAGSNRWR